MDDNSVLSGMDDNFILYLQAMRTKFTLFPLTVTSTSVLPPSGALKIRSKSMWSPCGRCGQEQDDNILTVLRNKAQVWTGGHVSQV